ncbi:MAG: hypothetical protein N2442_13980 [Spirochaetes bacterium]|nr:hypothetical protein [Spirochaetota bacterium]
MKTWKRSFWGIFFFCSSTLFLFPQTTSSDQPDWYLLEKGRDAFRKGNFAETLTLLKRFQAMHGEKPEAVFLTGQVYEAEGENRLAKKYYERSLELSKQFYVLEDKYQVFYRLAQLYLAEKRYKEYESILMEMLRDHPESRSDRFEKFRTSLVKSVTTDGLNVTLQLYRLKNDFATRANRELGIFYCRTRRSDKAILHLTLAQVAILSTLIEEMKFIDPGYQYKDLKELLTLAMARPYLKGFLNESGAWEGFYYLASSLYLHGVIDQAKLLWELPFQFAEGEMKARSQRQLQKPQPEPFIGF